MSPEATAGVSKAGGGALLVGGKHFAGSLRRLGRCGGGHHRVAAAGLCTTPRGRHHRRLRPRSRRRQRPSHRLRVVIGLCRSWPPVPVRHAQSAWSIQSGMHRQPGQFNQACIMSQVNLINCQLLLQGAFDICTGSHPPGTILP